MRWGCLLVSLLAASHASAAMLTPIGDQRSVVWQLYVCPGNGGFCTDQGDGRAPLAPFADFDETLAHEDSRASQVSSLSASGFSGSGGGYLALPSVPDFYDAYNGIATSTFDVSFVLDQAATVSLSGSLAFATTSAAATSHRTADVSLCAVGCGSSVLFARSLDSGPGLDAASEDFFFSELLSAGQYQLVLRARDSGAATAISEATFSFVLAVPEPSAFAYLALIAFAVGFDAAFRSTPR